jgi:magnesium transporter
MMQESKVKFFVRDYTHPITVVVHDQETVEEAVHSLRQKTHDGKILYFYVVDEDHRLQGIVSTRSLLLADPKSKIENVMDRTIYCLKEEDTFQHAVESLAQHRLLALPVVDHGHKLKGVVDIKMCLEENIDLFKEQRNQDIFQLVGMNLEEGTHRSPIQSYSRRMPWILCNVLGGIGCAIVSYVFKLVLGKVLILAMFIPLVLSLSESISMQSMTQSFQILRSNRISAKKVFHRMFSEMKVAILMALTSGVLVGVLSLFWHSELKVSLVIAGSIVFSVALSAIVGATIPLLLHLRKLDPRVASGPVVLTIADIFTTAIYLFTATCWLL